MSVIENLKTMNTHEAPVNAIDQETFHERVLQTFRRVSDILQKSIGPCGAPTIISNMPNYHITKDGFTIAKNIMFESSSGYVDQVIAYMIRDICDRLNFVVGDGTTSAILCTNKIYKSFQERKDEIAKNFFLPRDIIFRLQKLKNRIIHELEKEAQPIKNISKDEMLKAIRRVVYISSNGDDFLTDLIVSLYDSLEYPAIRVMESPDGVTRSIVSSGFEIAVQLTDKLYINTDDGIFSDDNLDVLMFDHKVNHKSLDTIILPLLMEVKARDRKLLVIAPAYDTVALDGIVGMLNSEFKMKGKISLVLTVCPTAREIDKKRFSDMAMLFNTEIITSRLESEISDRYSAYKESGAIGTMFNLDHRNIHGIKIMQIELMDETSYAYKSREEQAEMLPSSMLATCEVDNQFPGVRNGLHENSHRVGFVKHVSIGTKNSVFDGFYYNQAMFDAHMNDATRDYTEALSKYRNTGAFNFEIDECLMRMNSLKQKTGIIQVGANTSFAMAFEKDVVDDAVKAAESSFLNGVVLGKHVSMIRVLDRIIGEVSPQDAVLLTALKEGFSEVNYAVLENAFANISLHDMHVDIQDGVFLRTDSFDIRFDDVDVVNSLMYGEKEHSYDASSFDINVEDACYSKDFVKISNLHDFIVLYEAKSNTVLDLNPSAEYTKTTFTFSKDIINSCATDREILTAAIDLIGLLVTGNQLIISSPV